ncbi:hypothetical protein SAMN04487910_3480 [Aquimarina amphilecti]|uniref:Outer membrane lipoprotein-sorting protein n=1 Tax=Aquimarina amphilecti TaxID=1038014 RepID=A0A1H7TL53_AQUAM|nr:DUF6503 family protein [Aquimarina amphilecti]SEL85295.1 hypothetical protein SAMN04487910_3480 [Aquimarina amphilecti]
MKKIILSTLVLSVLFSCKETPKTEKEVIVEEKEEVAIVDRSKDFPTDIASVFKAHGGIQSFDEKNSLVFELANPEGNEKHTTDLKTRHARIETDKFQLGFDGKEAWIEQDSTYFKGNPRFYHNLMFYFYAMPFVLGDDGISYDKVEDLKVGETSYPGYKISYGEAIGDSPKDNYFVYYDNESYRMKYLGYTVTYFSKESSEKISLIEYSDWNDVDGLLLPKTLKWREYQDGVVGEVKSERNFVNASASSEKMDFTIFSKPKEAE